MGEMLVLVLAAIFIGLCLGSFTNALVWRFHEQSLSKSSKSRKQLSVFTGRSMCPNCRHTLAWHDLLPLISWLTLRGKCRYCGKPISWQYPLVEGMVALLVTISFVQWDFQGLSRYISFGFWLAYLVLLAALTVYDLRWLLLPNRLIYPLLFLAAAEVLVVSLAHGAVYPLIEAARGLLVLGGGLAVLFYASNGKWLGGGDVKLGAFMGILLGWQKSLLALMVASYVGVAAFIVLMIAKRIDRRQPIPFGPLLILATILTFFTGDAIISAYKTAMGL